ncbi:Hypothetical predicted protein [Mytilus galloprovincialis]|uniref:Uncharacterized protein n=1 Tax=Mytilus galloprovincialis TaxID=29158 RepID=A0A8B6CEB5_MYTGA|nr:Hypothetical predicted protein [Mytilus galloprovincialis]
MSSVLVVSLVPIVQKTMTCPEKGDYITKDQDVLYVTLSESMKDVSNEVTVIFDRPQINPGNHYNQNDGIYIAPLTGRLMAFWTIGTNETRRTELMVEDIVFPMNKDTKQKGNINYKIVAQL